MSTRAHTDTPGTQISWQPYAVLGIGLMAVSTAAILVRLAQDEGTPSLVLAAARLCIATLVLTPWVLRFHLPELRAVSLNDLKWALVSGVALGLHFAFWISSLEYTAVVNSVTIVTTNPLWVALLAAVLLGEKLNRRALIGLALALGGGILVGVSGGTGDPPTRNDPWLGNGLALAGALMVSFYFIIGRWLRAHLSVMVYIWLVYGAAALLLTVVVIVSGQQVGGLPGDAYLWMLLLGLIPQLIGHSSFNYALGYLPAAYVSLIVLVEPVGSGLLAVLFLEEWPVPLQLVGSAIILTGIGFATLDRRSSPPVMESSAGD